MSCYEYKIYCEPLVDNNELARDWSCLEKHANNNFFLSWFWMSVWLDTYKPRADVVRAYHKGSIVAIGIIVRGKENRSGFIPSRTIYLHETGRHALDQIWIEYNDFLTHAEHSGAAVSACVNYLSKHYGGWDEIVLGAVEEKKVNNYAIAAGLSKIILWSAPTYGVELHEYRKNSPDYLGALSSNTRYQIRRSQRKYATVGAVELEIASSCEESLEYFDAIAPFHINHWGSAPGESGFANSYFVSFHRSLIKSAWCRGGVELCRLLVDGEPVSYFYNFIYKNRVYFYLSGMRNESDSVLKPGMLGHVLSIQRYIELGYDYYDFMGGDARYKKSLGVKGIDLVRVRLQKPRFKFRVESVARDIKHRCLKAIKK